MERIFVKPGSPIKLDHLKRYQWAVNHIGLFREDNSCSTILDCACGCGYGSNLIAKNNPDCQIIGVDLSLIEAITFAKKWWATLPNLSFLEGDIQKLIFGMGVFDAIVSLESIEHTINPLKTLIELKRVLKPTGILILSFPSSPTIKKNHWHLSEVKNFDEAKYLVNLAGFSIRQEWQQDKSFGVFACVKKEIDNE